MLEQRRLLTNVVVNSLSDATSLPNGLIDLRMAIKTANSSTTPTTITFSSTLFSSNKKILLAGDALELSNTKEATTITGPTTGVTVQDSDHQEPDMGGIIIDAKVTATLTNLTITSGGFFTNSGIQNKGTVTLSNVVLSDNLCFRGAGISNSNTGKMTLTNVSLIGNDANGGDGGGIVNEGIMTLTDVTLSQNIEDTGGNDGGGGIDNDGTMTLTNTTITGNTSDSSGGGIFNRGTLTLTNVTIAGNKADNFDPESGGGIFNVMNAQVNVANSIIAGNTVNIGPDVMGSFNSFGNNLIGETDGSTGWNSADLTGTVAHPLNPKLGALAINGGLTQTMLPQAGSPVINAGSNALIPQGITTDQRGAPRISGGKVDIGAVEVQPTITFTPPPTSLLVSVNPRKSIPIIYKATAGQSSSEPLGSFTESTANGPYSIDVNWGDGTADTVFTQSAAGAIANRSHTFPAAGNDTVTISVKDSSGFASSSGILKVVVSAPTMTTTNSIIGLVFSDKNSNGNRDTGEGGLQGVTVYDDANNNSKFDPGEAFTTTDAFGEYTLSVAGSGAVVIRQVVPGSDTQTHPSGGLGIHLTLTGSSTFTGEIFGDHDNGQSTSGFLFRGTVFFDADKNGKQGSGEANLAGFEVYDDVGNKGKFVSGDPMAFTNASGQYTLGLLGSGAAIIRQILPANWSQIAPTSNGGYHITISSTAAASKYNFGDFTAIKYLKTVATTSGVVAWWTFDTASQANSIINGYTGALSGGAEDHRFGQRRTDQRRAKQHRPDAQRHQRVRQHQPDDTAGVHHRRNVQRVG